MSSVSSDQRKSIEDGHRKRSHVFQMWRLIMWRRLYTVNVSSLSVVMRTEKVNKACSSWRPSSGKVSHDVQCMMLSCCWRIRSGMDFKHTKIRTSRCCSGRGTSCQDSRNALPRVEGWGCHIGSWMDSSRERERSRKDRVWRDEWTMMAEKVEKWTMKITPKDCNKRQ